MNIKAIKTECITGMQDLNIFVDKYLPESIVDGCVIVVTSKIVSLCEGRIVPNHFIEKNKLVQQEADKIIPNPGATDSRIVLTYTHHMLIPSAGIDESNSNGNYILYPKDSFLSAKKLWIYLSQKRNLHKFGVLITDSHTTPLRRGVTGIALAWWGFNPTRGCVGNSDLFGKPLRVTHINIADALAVSAVYNMGESSECTPIAIISDIPHITFDSTEHDIDEIAIDPQEDLYRPLLKDLI